MQRKAAASVSLQTGCNREGMQAPLYVPSRTRFLHFPTQLYLCRVSCAWCQRCLPNRPCLRVVVTLVPLYTKRLVPTSRFRFETQHRGRSQCFVFERGTLTTRLKLLRNCEKHGAREGAIGTAASSLFSSCVMLLYQNAPAHSVVYKRRTE